MSVKVAVRSRPLSGNEQKECLPIIVHMNGNEVDVIHANGGTRRVFRYDSALWSTGVRVEGSTNEESSQEMVYDAIGAEMLDHALTGYNGCIFAYGQTGSGKTYTMMGTEDSPGIIPRLAENLFSAVERSRQSDNEVCIEVSYYEIYCEKVRCLLRPTAGGFDDTALRVREHPKYGPFIEGLAKFVVGSQQEFLQLMNDGNKVRTTASTAMNATSSRSHAVFAITLTQKRRKGKFVTTTTSKLNLVDLAGSERASKTRTTGQRFAEGANINQSLTCLGNVISALAEVEEKGRPRHIPYRDSVLTWILKDNLGGNSKTVMVAAVSPSAAQYEETMSTLRYAERAKKIVNKAVVNESNNNEVIAALQKEIAALKEQLSGASDTERLRLQEELAASEAVQKELSTSLEEKLAETKKMMEERERYMKELESKLEAQTNEIEALKRVNDEKEQKIADLLRRIDALALAASPTATSDDNGAAKGGDNSSKESGLVSSFTGKGQAMMEKMREEVAALEQEQNEAETQLKGKRRTADAEDADAALDIAMEAGSSPQELLVTSGQAAVGGRSDRATLAAPKKASSVYLDTVKEDETPAALKQGLRHSQASSQAPAGFTRSDDQVVGSLRSPGEADGTDGLFDVDLDSLDDIVDTIVREEEQDNLASSVDRTQEHPEHPEHLFPVDDDLDVDSDLAADFNDGINLEIDEDIILDDDEAKPMSRQHTTTAPAIEPKAQAPLDTEPTSSSVKQPTESVSVTATAIPRHVDPVSQKVATAACLQDSDVLGQPQPKLSEHTEGGYSQTASATNAPLAPQPCRQEQQPLRVESLQPGVSVAQQQHQQRQAMVSAAQLQTWAKTEARPEIFAPPQNVVELVIPSHALPNNRYLHEPFNVVKMNESAIIGHRKDRIWDIDFFNHTFGNYDVNGSKSFSLLSSHLFRVEKDPSNAKRLTLFFFEAPHPYELEFVSASRRRRFYELAMLQRRSSILWCPSLCLDRENDVAITVRGTTIDRPNRVVRVDGEAKFTVARMPYEVIDFWYGCLSLEGSSLPRNTAMLGSFMPKAAHDVYILGIADVPSSSLGNDDIGQYFVNYLGAADYYAIGTTTMDHQKRRSTYNAMLVICRRSFIVRISHVQLMEAPTVHKKDVSRGDFTGAACALNINEATICAIMVNAKQTKCSTHTRNACIRSLITSFPFGDTSLDIASRFDYLLISGCFGYSGSTSSAAAAFTAEDPLLQQVKLNNLLSNTQEHEPSVTLKLVRDPARILFAVRPRVSRMDVGLYTTSRAFPMKNTYMTADLFAQRTYLSVFGESVPRVQLIFDNLHVMGDRLPDVKNPQIQIRGDFFENAPLVARTITQGPKHYTAATTAVPIVYPTVSNNEFTRLQTIHFVLVGHATSGHADKATTLAAGALPIKNTLSLGETKDFAVPLYYHSCLVGVLQGNLLQIYYEKNYAELAAAGLGRERFVSLVNCYENQIRSSGHWVRASIASPFRDFSTKDPTQEQRMDGFELPDPRGWRWLTEWQHDSRTDDAEGWIYSDGGNAPLQFKEGKNSTIRRRRWMRAMQAQDATTLHSYLSFKYEQMKENVAE